MLIIPKQQPFGWPNDPNAARFPQLIFLAIDTFVGGNEVAVMRASFNNMGYVCKMLVTLTVSNEDICNHDPFSVLITGWAYCVREKYAACLCPCGFRCAHIVHLPFNRFGHYEYSFASCMQCKNSIPVRIAVMCDEHAVIQVMDTIPHVAFPAKVEHVWFAKRIHFYSFVPAAAGWRVLSGADFLFSAITRGLL